VEEIVYSIRRSDRARRVRVTVDAARGVEVVLPRRAAEREAAAAIRELRPWIDRRVQELARTQAVVAQRGAGVPYMGQLLAVRRERERTRVHRRGEVLLAPDGARCLPALERWYRRAARQEIAQRLDQACSVAGSSYSHLTIRGQRTRWASCSRGGAMSFNWRLLLAPEPVLDYVVWHEVCHLEVMDHSPRFWALLAHHRPDYREQAAWLRRHGATLVLEAS
jgi:predicted metal-dependent hydrolase